MAEKTIISSSQESLPLSEETCLLLLNNLGESFNSLMTDDATLKGGDQTPDRSDLNPQEEEKEKRILEERLGEVYRALSEEVHKSTHLSNLNIEMKITIHDLNEKLQNEMKGREQLEQAKLLAELRLKEKEEEMNELIQQLAKREEELNRTRLICYEEAAAKETALKRLKAIEGHSTKTSLQKQELQFNEVEDLYSYETFQPMDQIPGEDTPFNIPDEENMFSMCPILKTQSSLPATESWPGQFSFKVSFTTQENVKAQWVYSDSKNKLFVKKDAPCPINFSTMTSIDGFSIRTTAYYSSADHILDPVHRCVNHSMLEIQNNKPEAEHLVRVESRNAFYDIDPVTRRHSVVVPFENPAAGQQFSSYIFKFACFQSCSGGPNRRPLMLCFTLERRGVILGRQKVHLKICACPLRDVKTETSNADFSSENLTKKSVKRKKEEPIDSPHSNISEVNYDKPVKLRPGPFYLKVDERQNYEVLKFIAKVFLQPSNQPLKRSHLINLLRSNYSSSSEEERK